MVVVVVVSGVAVVVVVGMAVVGTGGGSAGLSVGAPVRLKEGKAGGSVGLAAILGGPGKKKKMYSEQFGLNYNTWMVIPLFKGYHIMQNSLY